jgi:hypothetical protein
MRKSIGVLIVILAGVLAACNGNSSVSTPPGTGQNCGGPPNQLQVLWPIPNSQNASGQFNNIYVSTKGKLPPSNLFNFYLVQSNGGSTFTSTFFGISASQIPSPHATPSYSNPIYYATSLPSGYIVGPAQSVTLLWNDGGTGCTPHTAVATFTTKS